MKSNDDGCVMLILYNSNGKYTYSTKKNFDSIKKKVKC